MRFKPSLAKIKSTILTKRNLLLFCGFILLFLLANLGTYFYYLHRNYPKTFVGNVRVGSIPYSDINQHATKLGALPRTIELKYQDKTSSRSSQALGIALDGIAIRKALQAERSWLPLLNLMRDVRAPAYTTINDKSFNVAYAELAKEFEHPAVDAKIVLENGTFSSIDATEGWALKAADTKRAIKDGLAGANATIDLPIEIMKPKVVIADIAPKLQSLQAQQSTPINLTYQTKSYKPKQQDIGSWYVEENSTYVLNNAKIKAYVESIGGGLGIRVQNINDLVGAIKSAVGESKPLEAVIVAAPIARKTYSYCVAARGVDAGYLTELSAKLTAVYGDARGWNLGGQVAFSPVSSGCNFTVWLSAASQMATFGTICDADWSCRVGANVVINFDRWQGASTAWNAAGGGLDDYRSMVINHETGHWFGFYHAHCGGAGQPAPVMQQQSINLEGCVFNAWPLQSEQTSLRNTLGF